MKRRNLENLFLGIVLCCVCSCATSRTHIESGLKQLTAATDTAESAVLASYKAQCRGVAEKCHDVGDRTCKKLSECHTSMRDAAGRIEHVRHVIAAGWLALSIDSKSEAAELVKAGAAIVSKELTK